jgi:preprotein translocase subunit SecG
MQTVILAIHLLLAIAMIGVILIQKSEGGGLGMGGGGMSGFMTGRSTHNLLTRTTAGLATAFFVTSIALALMAGMQRTPHSFIEQTQSRTALGFYPPLGSISPGMLTRRAAGNLPVSPALGADTVRAGAATDLSLPMTAVTFGRAASCAEGKGADGRTTVKPAVIISTLTIRPIAQNGTKSAASAKASSTFLRLDFHCGSSWGRRKSIRGMFFSSLTNAPCQSLHYAAAWSA